MEENIEAPSFCLLLIRRVTSIVVLNFLPMDNSAILCVINAHSSSHQSYHKTKEFYCTINYRRCRYYHLIKSYLELIPTSNYVSQLDIKKNTRARRHYVIKKYFFRPNLILWKEKKATVASS